MVSEQEFGVDQQQDRIFWKETPVIWGALLVSLLVVIYASFDGLKHMVHLWEVKEEYSHSYLIPFISLFLIWQKKDLLWHVDFNGSWWGALILLFGFTLIFIGNVSATSTVIQYGFLLAILGIALSYTGREGFKLLFFPLIFLLFMIPLPGIFLYGLSAKLQLISSELGVAVIRLFDISVYLEGNVIDLGTYKLQVVEACNGLRYLFPLMSLAFICAYFFKVAFWMRALVFLSSIPLTIFMNSFRIGVIGVLVEYWGQSQAEGFLHDFEGWVVFMACILLILLEMWVLAKFTKEKRPLREVFGLEYPENMPADAKVNSRKLPVPFITTLSLVIISASVLSVYGKGERIEPQRSSFNKFPLVLGEWQGKADYLEQIYLDSLKLDDYFIGNYKNTTNNSVVNFYTAYYASQDVGEAAHSPRSCIPGGGWKIKQFSPKNIDQIKVDGSPLQVNRLVIQKGDYKQIAYYWFRQRGRNITSEYLVKFYMLWDALKRKRTDGALVRLTTLVKPGEDLVEADNRIQGLLVELYPVLDEYIPE